jgi:hypothetical protein
MKKQKLTKSQEKTNKGDNLVRGEKKIKWERDGRAKCNYR